MKQFFRGLALAAGIFFWANAGAPGNVLAADGLRLYAAQPGDNFQILSQRVGYPPELLAALNNLSAGYSCLGGEQLRLPADNLADNAVNYAGADSSGRPERILASRSSSGRMDYALGTSTPVVWAAPLLVPGVVTSTFGSNRSSTGPHHGMDIAVPQGTAILAAHGGTVLEAGWKNDVYGNAVILEHGNGWETLYAHCSEVLVQPGQQVGQGQKIALVGSTGNSTGPHLHLELHKDGAFLDPAYFFTNLLLEKV